MEIHCFAPFPFRMLAWMSLQLLVIVIVTTYKSSSWSREKGAAGGCEERHKGSFKGSKTGVGFLHVYCLATAELMRYCSTKQWITYYVDKYLSLHYRSESLGAPIN